MNPIFEAAWEFEQFLDSQQWGFCFIGGLTEGFPEAATSNASHRLLLLLGFSFGPKKAGDVSHQEGHR